MVIGREERNTGDRRTREKTDRRWSEDPGVRGQQKRDRDRRGGDRQTMLQREERRRKTQSEEARVERKKNADEGESRGRDQTI